MKMKTKRLLAAVHDLTLPDHKPCNYFTNHPIRYESMGMPIWDKNPRTGAEFEVEVVIVYNVHLGKNYTEDPPEVEFLQIWHYRKKVGLWHRMHVSHDTEDYLCDLVLEKEIDRRTSDDSRYWDKINDVDFME